MKPSKLVFVVDDDPTTNHENWPTPRQIRVAHQPRCHCGRFIAKSAIKTHHPRYSTEQTWWSWDCPSCGPQEMK